MCVCGCVCERAQSDFFLLFLDNAMRVILYTCGSLSLSHSLFLLFFPQQEKWSALLDVRTILLSIQSLLAEPNNDSPLNSEAAELWENQAGEWLSVIRQ